MEEKFRPLYKPPGMSSDVIIFHPGSRHLYFGRATDPEPHSILHIIARRRKDTDSKVYRDTIGPTFDTNITEEVSRKIESCRHQVLQTLEFSLQRAKNKSSRSVCKKCNCDKTENFLLSNDRTVSSSISSILSKREIKQEIGGGPCHADFKKCQYVVGNDVLKIGPDQPYNIHCPWKRGQLNVHRDVGGSLSSVIEDMEDIWKWCVEEKLGIPAREFNKYRAIVIIPAMFDRVHAKEITELVIKRLGFRCAFLMQDHVSASFGCGIPCTTVVDIGDQKISMSCVEDGVSYPQSRIELKFGGGDLTIALWRELHLMSFQEDIDLTQLWNFEYINTLKEAHCHLDWKIWDSNQNQPKTIMWNKPGHTAQEYKVRFGNELMIVPLGYFNPDLLRVSLGKKIVTFYEPQPSVSDDPLDRIYLTETSKKLGAKTNEEEVANDEDDSRMSIEKLKTNDCKASGDSCEVLLGVDRAILQSIERCSSSDDNLLHRLSSNILLVGGGCKVNGLVEWLTNRLKILMPRKRKKVGNSLDFEELDCRIISCSRELDAAVISWKGAAILSSLESSKDLWIGKEEWRIQGSKILREKSLFQF